MEKSVPTLGVSLPQKTRYVHSLRSWLVILLAGLLFFMSMSSLAWGLTSLINDGRNGGWFLLGGMLFQAAAIASIWKREKRALAQFPRS